jgi:hypothetical protein
MRLFLSVLVIAGVITQPVFAQSAAPQVPTATSAQIEKGISEAARSLQSLSRILAVMGPGLSKAMQAAGPGIGRAVERAQPSLERAHCPAGNGSPRIADGVTHGRYYGSYGKCWCAKWRGYGALDASRCFKP